MDENKDLTVSDTETAVAPQSGGYVPTIWNDPNQLKTAYSAAKYLAASMLVPEQTYKGKPENCLVALDLANRLNLAPLMVMQNLYIVKGKPAWSGQFCIALINACGRFSPLDFTFTEEFGGGCYASATRLFDGKFLQGTTITMQMAKDEGWLDRSGSKWKTMPEQMLKYRAAAFFARTYCPDILCGVPTEHEVRDVEGYDEPQKQTVVIEM